MRNRIFGLIGVLWGGFALLSRWTGRTGGATGDGAYDTGQTIGFWFSLLMFVAGAYYLIVGDGNPFARTKRKKKRRSPEEPGGPPRSFDRDLPAEPVPRTPRRKPIVTRNRIFGLIGVLWGGFMLFNRHFGQAGEPSGDPNYDAGLKIGYWLGVLMFVVGLYYLIVGDDDPFDLWKNRTKKPKPRWPSGPVSGGAKSGVAGSPSLPPRRTRPPAGRD